MRVVSAEIERDGAYLITQRSEHAVLPLLWEFPGGRVHDGESETDALKRAVRSRLGVEVRPLARVMEVSHPYDDYTVVLCVYQCALVSGEPEALGVAALAWVTPEQFADYEFPGADGHTVELLLTES
ncbi:MAG: (deoxy)nucleoside triphosphate pyrophosphohydrolase [Myxococcales bacterium]|nr:(deoxy)nucleoside triphosphate pyrophosphohydrolase [Myxococcales bacterium]